jgi:three-Cys-motif partner protein
MSDLPVDDGMEIPVVGPWSRRKYHFLGRYLNAFTTAMKDKWRELHYVDLFAGAGIARIKTTDELVYSSALLAARTRFPFTRLHLCDSKQSNVEALRRRLAVLPLANTPRLLLGDANDKIDELLSQVPTRHALCMTFADPFGLHLDFDTVKAVATRQSDLVVLIADNMDALRNWEAYYDGNPNSNLDRFMGEPGWRDIFKSTSPDRQAAGLRKRYRERLETCGYAHFAEIRVQNQSDRDIYTLLYASKSKAGLTIWNGISMKDEGGQMGLNFDP